MFLYSSQEITTILDDNIVWFKGIDIAAVLNYKNDKKAIQMHVDEDDKITFKNLMEKLSLNQFEESVKKPFSLTPQFGGSVKCQPTTMFINESGLYSLILRSKQPDAKKFKSWITKDLLPSLRKTGFYTMQPNTESIYNDNMLLEYDNKNCVYIAYIGIHNNEPLYKFGKTADVYRRQFNEHAKLFDTFNLIYIKETDNKDAVEEKFKKELKCKQLLRQSKTKNKQQIELFTVTEIYTIDDVKGYLDNIVATCILPSIKDRDDRIKILDEEDKKKDDIITFFMKYIDKMQDEKEDLKILYEKQINTILELNKEKINSLEIRMKMIESKGN